MSWPTPYGRYVAMHTQLPGASFYNTSVQNNLKCCSRGIDPTLGHFAKTNSHGSNSSNSISTREHRAPSASAPTYTLHEHTRLAAPALSAQYQHDIYIRDKGESTSARGPYVRAEVSEKYTNYSTQVSSKTTSRKPHSSFPIPADLLPVIATRFINTILNSNSTALVDLIKRVTRLMRLTPYTIVGSLLLLQKLQVMYHNLAILPVLHSPKRLFMPSVMLTYKANMEDTHYRNDTWAQATGGVFQAAELTMLEREFCQYLNWDLQMTTSMILTFAEMLMRDFSHGGPYLLYEGDLLKEWKEFRAKRKREKKMEESFRSSSKGSGNNSLGSCMPTSSKASVYVPVAEYYQRYR